MRAAPRRVLARASAATSSSGSYTGFSDQPAYADARSIADDLMTGYIDGKLDRVEIVYNAYISPLTQSVTRETAAAALARRRSPARSEDERGAPTPTSEGGRARWSTTSPSRRRSSSGSSPTTSRSRSTARCVESTAGFFGAQMTAMRSASDNAGEIITDYTLQMNRARQAEITQEIMEVVAGAEGLS